MSTERSPRQDAHSLLTTAASVALGFALNFAAARTLGPANKGMLDLAGASAGLFTLLLGFSVNAGLARHVATERFAPAGLARVLWLWGILAGFFSAALLLALPGVASALGLLPRDEPGFWTLFRAAAPGAGVAAAALRGVAVGRGALIAANRIDLLVKFLLLLAYAAVALAPAKPTARALALVTLPVMMLLPLLLHFAQRGPLRTEPGALRSIVVATLPLHGANLLHFLNQKADLFFLQSSHGSTEVGLYSLAVSLGQTVLLLSSALAVPLLPQVASAPPGPAAEIAAAACRRYVFLGGCSAVFLGACAPWLVPLVFGRDFSGSSAPLFMLLPGMIGFGLVNLLVSYFAGTGQNAVNLRVSLLGLVLTIAGNLTLTLAFGATGAAAASTLAYAGMATASLLAFSRRSGHPARIALFPDRETLRSTARMLAHLRP